MGFKLQHWGVVLGPRETVKCNPGQFTCYISQVALHAGKGNEDVRIFMKVDDKESLIGTLSDDKYPHYATELIFEKEFELRQTSETRNVSILGYKHSRLERKSSSSTEDGESDEEVPQALPIYPSADDDKSKETESEKPATTQSSTFKETKDPGELQTTVGGSDDDESDEDYVNSEDGESNDDEDSSDEADRESSDDDDGENFPNLAKTKNRPAEKPLKTPPGKKAKMTTPSKGNNTGSASGTGTRTGYVHVATPYPSKNVKSRPSLLEKKTPLTGDMPKQPAGYACGSCSRTFYSYIALKTHCKVKKHKRSPHKSQVS